MPVTAYVEPPVLTESPRPDKGKARERPPPRSPTPTRSHSSRSERFLAELAERFNTPRISSGRRTPAREQFLEELAEIPGSSAAPSSPSAPGSPRPGSTRAHVSRDRLLAEINKLEDVLARSEAAESGLSTAHRELARVRADLAAERKRADAAERRSGEAAARAREATERATTASTRAQVDATRLREYRTELETAHSQLRIAQSEINRLAAEKHSADEAAARARTTARRTADMLATQRARDEGRRAGIDEARSEWERVLAHEQGIGGQENVSDPHYVRPRRNAARANEDTVELLRARLHNALGGGRPLATPGPRLGRLSYATQSEDDDHDTVAQEQDQEIAHEDEMARRTEARVALLFPPSPMTGLTSCIWHSRHPELFTYRAPGTAPADSLNCGCSIEGALFEESLLRNGVIEMVAGQTSLDVALRGQLLELLKHRYNYRDGDFEIDPQTGDWVEGDGVQVWANGL